MVNGTISLTKNADINDNKPADYRLNKDDPFIV